MTVEQVLSFAWPWLSGMTIAIFAPHILLHGLQAPESATSLFIAIVLLILAYLIGVVLHEACHVVGMLIFGRVSLRSVEWGHRISEGVVYVHTTEPMSARAYRGVLLLPGIVTGIVPVLVGWWLGSMWLTAFGWLMTTSAVGDLAILRLIRDLRPEAPLQDHPQKVGVVVLDPQLYVTEETE